MTQQEIGISIVTAHYNHSDLIERCIQSTRNQSTPVHEHIVVDDGSAPDHVAVLRELDDRYPHIRVIYKDVNTGAPATFAQGVAEATGSHVLVMSADDCLRADFVEKYNNVLTAHPDAALVMSNPSYRNEGTGEEWGRTIFDVDAPMFLNPDKVVEIQKKGFYLLNGTNSLVRTDLLKNSEVSDPKLRWHHDWIALFTVAYRFGVWYVPTSSNIISVQEGSYSKGAMIWDQQKVVLDYMLAMIDTKKYDDVRGKYIESEVLAFFPYSLHFLLLHSQYWKYLSVRFILRSFLVHLKRRLFQRNMFVQKMINSKQIQV